MWFVLRTCLMTVLQKEKLCGNTLEKVHYRMKTVIVGLERCLSAEEHFLLFQRT